MSRKGVLQSSSSFHYEYSFTQGPGFFHYEIPDVLWLNPGWSHLCHSMQHPFLAKVLVEVLCCFQASFSLFRWHS